MMKDQAERPADWIPTRGIGGKKSGMVRGSELLVVLTLLLMAVVITAAFAAAGYYTSVSMGTSATETGKTASGKVPFLSGSATVPGVVADAIPFLVVPSVNVENGVKVKADEDVRIIGKIEGADRVEVAYVPREGGAPGNVVSGPTGPDGTFDVKTSFASGTVGDIVIKAYADATLVATSLSKGIITE